MYADEQDRISHQDNQPATQSRRSATSGIIIDVLVFGVLAAIAAYIYIVLTDKDVILESASPSQAAPSVSQAATESVATLAAPEAKPLPLEEAETEQSYGLPEDVPKLNTSDELLLDQLRMFTSLEAIIDWSQAADLARRFVSLVYNMSEGSLPHKYLPLFAPQERFSVISKGGLKMNPKSYQRYDVYAKAFAGIDTDHLAATYRFFWPVLNKAFQELGEPKKSLHSETLKAIEHVLAAPVIDGDIRLVQPAVYYRFADSELESLSSVQKQMLRIGPDNSALVKAKLKEIQAKITAER